MELFDTHAHYYDGRFDSDREEVVSALPRAGVKLVLCPGCDLPSSRACVELAERYPLCICGSRRPPRGLRRLGGYHGGGGARPGRPSQSTGHRRDRLGLLLERKSPKELQQHVFRCQLELAEALRLPVIVHDRKHTGIVSTW